MSRETFTTEIEVILLGILIIIVGLVFEYAHL